MTQEEIIRLVNQSGGGVAMLLSSPPRIGEARFIGNDLERFVDAIRAHLQPLRPLVAAGHFEMTTTGRREVSKIFADSADVEILYHDPEWPFHSSPKVDALRKENEEVLAALKSVIKELHACQAVIHLAGGFDPAYVTDAQAALKGANTVISKLKGGAA